MGELTVHTGSWTVGDRFASPWHYLPIGVSPGTAALRVTLEYERDGAVLGLGCLGPGGFRGWSGGSRQSFVIAAGLAISRGLDFAAVTGHGYPVAGKSVRKRSRACNRTRWARTLSA
jgi:hypothetical protein